jgi:hypothetical protein
LGSRKKQPVLHPTNLPFRRGPLPEADVPSCHAPAFNTTNRLADAFGFEVLSPENFEAGAKYLLKRGYR